MEFVTQEQYFCQQAYVLCAFFDGDKDEWEEKMTAIFHRLFIDQSLWWNPLPSGRITGTFPSEINLNHRPFLKGLRSLCAKAELEFTVVVNLPQQFEMPTSWDYNYQSATEVFCAPERIYFRSQASRAGGVGSISYLKNSAVAEEMEGPQISSITKTLLELQQLLPTALRKLTAVPDFLRLTSEEDKENLFIYAISHIATSLDAGVPIPDRLNSLGARGGTSQPFQTLKRAVDYACDSGIFTFVAESESVRTEDGGLDRDVVSKANSIDTNNHSFIITFHSLLASRLRGFLASSWLSNRTVTRESIYLANRLVMWRTPVDAVVQSLLPLLLSDPDALTGSRKRMAQQLLCWYWPEGFGSIRSTSQGIMEQLGIDLATAYEAVKADGTYGRMLTAHSGMLDMLQIPVSNIRNQLSCWDIFEKVQSRKLREIGLPSDWSLNHSVMKLCMIDDPIECKTCINFKNYYISFLHVIALKLNPFFQADIKAIYEQVKSLSDPRFPGDSGTGETQNEDESAGAGEHGACEASFGYFPAPVKSIARALDKEQEYRTEFRDADVAKAQSRPQLIPPYSPPAVELSDDEATGEHSLRIRSDFETLAVAEKSDSTAADAVITEEAVPSGWVAAVLSDNFAHYIIDWVRCAVVVRDAQEAVELICALARRFRICRVKNSLSDENASSYGYRSVLVSIEYNHQDSVKMIAEVQIMLRSFYVVRKKMHLYYKILRAENAWRLADDFIGYL